MDTHEVRQSSEGRWRVNATMQNLMKGSDAIDAPLPSLTREAVPLGCVGCNQLLNVSVREVQGSSGQGVDSVMLAL